MGLKKIGGVWIKESKKGEIYYSGQIKDVGFDPVNILIFKNKKKEGKQPDYHIFIREDE